MDTGFWLRSEHEDSERYWGDLQKSIKVDPYANDEECKIHLAEVGNLLGKPGDSEGESNENR